MKVKKYDALGNDFFVAPADELRGDPSELAVTWCDSETGLTVHGDDTGADGLLQIEPLPGKAVQMQLFEPDGSTSPMCGNGVRCVAKWAHDVLGYTDVTVETDARNCQTSIIDDGAVMAELEPPSHVDEVDESRLREALSVQSSLNDVSLVDSGVYHMLIQVEDVSAEPLHELTAQVREAVSISQRVNVTLWEPTTTGVKQRTYEFGVEDETDACGTGALAIGYHADCLGIESGRISVRPPGGELCVTLQDDTAILSGAADQVGETECNR